MKTKTAAQRLMSKPIHPIKARLIRQSGATRVSELLRRLEKIATRRHL